MAVKRNKDKEIEDLKARNEYLEKKSKIVTTWKDLTKGQRLFLSLIWTFAIVLIAFVITLSVVKINKNPMENKDDYERIVGSIDGREWKVSESTNKALLSFIPLSRGEASTIKEGERIELIIPTDSGDKYIISFSYNKGRIVGIWGGMILYLEYTESVYGGGRTLTLQLGNEKIVFKEKR